METIGTVGMYLPYMDPQTKKIVLSTVKEADNFCDFVQSLTKRACQPDSLELTVFFAVHFAALLFDFHCLNSLAKAHGRVPIIRPNLFYGSAIQGRHEDFEKVRESVDEVLSTDLPDWLTLEMYLIRLEAENAEYPKIVHDTKTLERIEDMLDENPEFDFFKSRLDDLLSIRAIRDGDVEKALELNQSATESAEKHNDVNRLAHLLRTRGGILQSIDREETEAMLLRSRDLMESMGDKSGISGVLFHLSKLESISGRYDPAIEHNLECVRIGESISEPTGMYALTLSTLYNVVGRSDAGVEWARMAETELANRPTLQPRAVLNQAWSMALQNKLTEAHFLVDSVRESILKSGVESSLGWLYFVTSVLEAAEGQYSSAAISIEDALDIYERSGGYVSFYICLHHRAKYEVLASEVANSSQADELIGPWLTSLEERSRDENLPGILGQALLLKANLLASRGDITNSMIVAEELSSLVSENGLSFLEPAFSRLVGSFD
ncbi:MAG: hypothetical protein JSW61_01495 [Candidatus Thorarchaeota archaeon]|nr:MAG: hypothetical protein JSW61_01495 [Candidatus Thorarchaeota archaeon]